MDGLNLSKRLQTVADLVDIGDRVADIGTDHAYLPINLVITRTSDFVIASDYLAGPFSNAQKEVTENNLNDLISLRQANGLEAIDVNDQIDTIVLAGMGAELIVNILSQKNIDNYKLILQANSEVPLLRDFLSKTNHKIVAEQIIYEQHFYQIIKAIPGKETLSSTQIKYGPILLQEKNRIFMKYWQSELNRLEKICLQLKKTYQESSPKYVALQSQIIEISTIINSWQILNSLT